MSSHGVIHGRQLNFKPMPPATDILGKALSVPNLPTHKSPKENWKSRFARVLARFHLGGNSQTLRQQWKAQDTILSLLASLSTVKLYQAEAKERRLPIISVRHPYHLNHAFEMIPRLPNTLGAERRFMEVVLSRSLKKFGEQTAAARGGGFSFEKEANEYFRAGFRFEQLIGKMNDEAERFAATQKIYDNYFHGRHYYTFALLRRERLAAESQLFFYYIRASAFISRIDWNGELLPKPNPRTLPTREDLTYLVQRDKSVLARYRESTEFQQQIKTLLKSFPSAN